MSRRIKITKLPEAKHGGSTKPFPGPKEEPPVDRTAGSSYNPFTGGNDPEIKINKTLKPTSKENAKTDVCTKL